MGLLTFEGSRSPPVALCEAILTFLPVLEHSSARYSEVSHTSRTHVPSLTAQGFHKPMSSHRLQAMRRPPGGRATKPPDPIPDGDGDADDAGSMASSRQGPVHAMPKGHRPAVSLATDFTQSETPDSFDGASRDQVSNPDGDTGLVDGARREKQRPKHLNIAATHTTEGAPQKSPHSFRSGFSLRSKNRLEPVISICLQTRRLLSFLLQRGPQCLPRRPWVRTMSTLKATRFSGEAADSKMPVIVLSTSRVASSWFYQLYYSSSIRKCDHTSTSRLWRTLTHL